MTMTQSPRRWTPTLEVESLRAIPAYQACSAKTLRRVRRHSDLVTCTPGTVIHPRTHPLCWVYAILDGTVAVEDAAETRLASTGECVGLDEALLERQPILQISAVTVATLAVTSQTELIALAENSATLALGIARSVARA